MWLASVSRRVGARIIPTTRWDERAWKKARALLDDILDGVGDDSGLRYFRMQITACLHRPLSVAEEVALPETWKACAARDLAGGPVAVLESRGLPGGRVLSAESCYKPTKRPIAGLEYDADLWLPIDCGLCPPCRARSAIEASV